MRRHTWILGLAVLALTAGGTRAEEVLHLTNGTFLPIRSHELKDGMIHVDLGENGAIAFPEYMVESIEQAGANVKIAPGNSSGAHKANRTVASRAGSDSSSKGSGSRQMLDDGLAKSNVNNVEIDEKTGLAVYKPFKDSQQAAKRRMGSVGNMRALRGARPGGDGSGTFRGTTVIGNRQIIGNNGPRGRNRAQRPEPVGMEMNPGTGTGAGGDTRSSDGSSGRGAPGGGDGSEN